MWTAIVGNWCGHVKFAPGEDEVPSDYRTASSIVYFQQTVCGLG